MISAKDRLSQCEGVHNRTSLMFVLTSPAGSCTSCPSYLDSFRGGGGG